MAALTHCCRCCEQRQITNSGRCIPCEQQYQREKANRLKQWEEVERLIRKIGFRDL